MKTNKVSIILSSRCVGKRSMMNDQINALLDDNPRAVLAVVHANGVEVFENAEFVVLEKPTLAPGNLEVKLKI